MRREGLTPKADATTNHNGANKARNAGIDVHDRAAGKVEGSLASQPANGCRNAVDFGLSGGFIPSLVAAASCVAASTRAFGSATPQTQCATGK